jgi:hypothetical protein
MNRFFSAIVLFFIYTGSVHAQEIVPDKVTTEKAQVVEILKQESAKRFQNVMLESTHNKSTPVKGCFYYVWTVGVNCFTPYRTRSPSLIFMKDSYPEYNGRPRK